MSDKQQSNSAGYAKAQTGAVSGKSPAHPASDSTGQIPGSSAASSAMRPEENNKNPNMPCKNSLPT